MTTARQSFPLGALEDVKRWRTARWTQERQIREQLMDSRRKLYALTGQVESPTMLKAGVKYAPMVEGFTAAWRIVEQAGGWSDEVLRECQRNADVRQALSLMGLGPPTLESLGTMVRSEEFSAFREDTKFLKCLAAERKAFDVLPQVIATTMARDQAQWTAIRKRETLRDVSAAAVAEAQRDPDVTVSDLDVLLESFEEDDT